MGSLVVVITGANSGIGLHMAAALLERGHHVAGFDLATDKLDRLASTYVGRVRSYRVDITVQEHVQTAVGDVVEQWGRIDVLVNNACRCTFGPFERSDIGRIRRELEVNLLGYMRMIQAVLPHMQERRRGVIHNVSSVVGLTGFPDISAYTASKGAIEAFTRSLALELRRDGISVHLVHPPLTNTPSASPLGIPGEVMADPAVVGRKLAARIMSKRAVITPGFGATMGILVSRWFPGLVGRVLALATERAKREAERGAVHR